VYRDFSETLPLSVHLEDAREHRRLRWFNLLLHTQHGAPSVFSLSRWIFDGYIFVAVAATAGIHLLKDAPFLAPVDFVSKPDQVLFVNHAMHRCQHAGVLVTRINALADGHDMDAAIHKRLRDFQCV
jgi:hypothetical protein